MLESANEEFFKFVVPLFTLNPATLADFPIKIDPSILVLPRDSRKSAPLFCVKSVFSIFVVPERLIE